ncbi:MAG TPA: histidine kinase [Symbiobacteriaceae bacterium]|nr:histidine kinase [Symbiobacteriaceae bacterium]
MRPLTRRRLLLAVTFSAVLCQLLIIWTPPHWRVYAQIALAAQILVLCYLVLKANAPEEEPPSKGLLESISSFDTTLRIGDETLDYLKQGLNEESAQKICEIIHKITEVDAVAITDDRGILGFHGVGCRRHRQGGPILTGATAKVLASGETMIVTDPRILSCDEQDCPHPLKSAVITPLRYRGRVVGTFKLYRSSSQPFPHYIHRLAVGIAALLGIQMELGEADRQRELVTKARFEALQAQIRPHFLFNVLNTIILLTRTDVAKARELLITLAQFFRRTLANRGNQITLADEVEYVNTYLSLEKARFGDKLQVRMRIDPELLRMQVPVLTLQPLVENAVVHGLAPKEDGGRIAIRIHRVHDDAHLFLCDSGVGIGMADQPRVFEEGYGENMGLGLTNVNERLISLYGEEYGLRIRSRPGRGTAVLVRIPLRQGEVRRDDAESADRR